MDGNTRLAAVQEKALEDFVTIWPAMSDEQRKSAIRMLVRMQWMNGFRSGAIVTIAAFVLLMWLA